MNIPMEEGHFGRKRKELASPTLTFVAHENGIFDMDEEMEFLLGGGGVPAVQEQHSEEDHPSEEEDCDVDDDLLGRLYIVTKIDNVRQSSFRYSSSVPPRRFNVKTGTSSPKPINQSEFAPKCRNFTSRSFGDTQGQEVGMSMTYELTSMINDQLSVLESTREKEKEKEKEFQGKSVERSRSDSQAADQGGSETHCDVPVRWIITNSLSPPSSVTSASECGLIQVQYEQFRSRCLMDRAAVAAGQSQEMKTLLRFWSEFLRVHFHKGMYEEFKTIALEEAEAGDRYGLESLFRFYSNSLARNFRPPLMEDFEQLTLLDVEDGHMYGLQRFMKFLKRRPETEVPESLAAILQDHEAEVCLDSPRHDYRQFPILGSSV